ncbi:peroxisomal succinyl-coenzyme A thioesterase-like [Genypterus blacodes]|uniref:peroxisomal succinyl-coenzyme A thioesterase-like n=1 Tax=Genypterus blacodes TaxID=154954 RepID=UPI003F75E632
MNMEQQCVKLSVQPSRGLMDEKFCILLHNVQPAAQITLHALHQCEAGVNWESFGHYTADASGRVNVCEDVSLGGTYTGVEPMGLLWSLGPAPGSKPWPRWRKMEIQTPVQVQVSAFQGFLTNFVDDDLLARVQVERWYVAPGVHRIPVTEGGLTATLFLPPGPGPFPGVLDLWGGGGGLVECRSALLASHGFASLALDYVTPRVTMETGKYVTNQYFEVAFTLLQQHPKVLSSRMAMMGLSLGTSMTLKMATYSSIMKLSCVVCVSGSHVQPVDGSLAELYSYFEKNSGKTRINEENQMIWRDLLLPIPTERSHKVDVGQLQCPLLLIVGEDDQNWPSTESAHDMEEMMERAGNSHLLTVLSYPNAGHLIEIPYSPHTRASAFRTVNSKGKAVALWGGETASHAHAQEDSWTKMLSFLYQHLYAPERTTSNL